jgi:hypothetical protein
LDVDIDPNRNSTALPSASESTSSLYLDPNESQQKRGPELPNNPE